ncbi:hypothetical protein V2J09_010596 [Rumex salicifolius]
MGKKKKNKRAPEADPSSSQHPKRRKVAGPSSPSPPPPPPKSSVNYDEMPPNFKKTFYIDDDCGGMKKYIEVLSWMKTLVCFDGSVFEGIGNLNLWKGYPLIEIEVFTPGKKSSRFLICRKDLYLIAFYAGGCWRQFNCDYSIENFEMLYDYKGIYTTTPWDRVGPGCMIDALNVLSSQGQLMQDYVAACEVFMVHLCEAARFTPIESIISRNLVPNADAVNAVLPVYDKRTFEDEEEPLHGAKKSDVYSDVYSDVVGLGPIDSSIEFKTPGYIKLLIKNYRKLSQIWYVYALTGKKFFSMERKTSSELNIKSIKSLRCTLATLCNINLDAKVLREWERKSLTHTVVTSDVYKEMKNKVIELQKQNKVLKGGGEGSHTSVYSSQQQALKLAAKFCKALLIFGRNASDVSPLHFVDESKIKQTQPALCGIESAVADTLSTEQASNSELKLLRWIKK